MKRERCTSKLIPHKRRSMTRLTQHDCNRIARQLNQRPRKRLGYRTPEEVYEP